MNYYYRQKKEKGRIYGREFIVSTPRPSIQIEFLKSIFYYIKFETKYLSSLK